MSNYPNLGREPIKIFGKEVTMTTFWDLVKNSTIVQGVITIAVIGVTCYLWATGQQVPQELWTADGIIIGFFFGSKTTQIARR